MEDEILVKVFKRNGLCKLEFLYSGKYRIFGRSVIPREANALTFASKYGALKYIELYEEKVTWQKNLNQISSKQEFYKKWSDPWNVTYNNYTILFTIN